MKAALLTVLLGIIGAQSGYAAGQETQNQVPTAASTPTSVAAGAQTIKPQVSIQAVTPKFSFGVADVVKLVQGGVQSQVVLAYVQNSPIAYSPTADELLRLKEVGIPSEITTAMINHGAELREKREQMAASQATNVPPSPQVAYPQQTAPVEPSTAAPAYTYATPDYGYVPYPVLNYTYVNPFWWYSYPSYYNRFAFHRYPYYYHRYPYGGGFRFATDFGSVRYSPYINRGGGFYGGGNFHGGGSFHGGGNFHGGFHGGGGHH